MAIATGSVTVTSGSGSFAVTLTNDATGLTLASGFQSTAAAFVATAPGFYAASSSPGPIVALNNLGFVGFSASAASTVIGGDGTNVFFGGGSGASVVTTGDGNDTVVTGAGNDTVALGTGSNQYYLGTGSVSVESAGNDLIQGGVGAATVNVNGANTDAPTIYGGPGALTIDDQVGTTLSVVGGNATSVFGASSGVTTVDGSDAMTVFAGSGGVQYAQLGSVGATFVGNGGNVTVNGGAAVETLYGASGSVISLIGSTANNVFAANQTTFGGSGGSVTFDGSEASGGNQFWAGSGNASLIGGTGNDTLVGGTGFATLTGGAGANEFDKFASPGASATLTVTDFDTAGASDVVKLFGYSSAQQTVVAGSDTIKLSDGSSITLQGYNSTLTNGSNLLVNPNT